MQTRHAATHLTVGIATAAALIYGGGAIVSFASEYITIDFESYAESTPIDDQYAALGVSFSIADAPSLRPVITAAGGPQTGFGSGAATDTPLPSGIAALTDPVLDGDMTRGNDIAMHFDPPVEFVRFFLVDVDHAESYLVHAYRGDLEVQTVAVVSGQSGTGNAISTPVTLASPDLITDIVIDIPDHAGVAIDLLTFRRPDPGAAIRGQRVRVSQESLPGLGDFDDNVLGIVTSQWTNTGPESYYLYDVRPASYGGAAIGTVADRSHLVLTTDADGLNLVVVHDQPNTRRDLDGGRAEMRVDVTGNSSIWRSLTEEFAGSVFDYATTGGRVFGTRSHWYGCCTDGYVISGLECGASAIVEFADVDGDPDTPAFTGLREWMAYSATGDQIPLALESGRRVRLDVLGAADCVGDLDCNGVVNGFDVMDLMTRWGEGTLDGDGLGDVNVDGVVDAWDLAVVLGMMGVCPEPTPGF